MQLSQALSYKTFTMLISVIVTNFRDNFYLNKLLFDLSKQDFDKKKLEILLLDAGNYQEKEAKKWLGPLKNNLRFWNVPNLPRTSSLNFLIKKIKVVVSGITRDQYFMVDVELIDYDRNIEISDIQSFLENYLHDLFHWPIWNVRIV